MSGVDASLEAAFNEAVDAIEACADEAEEDFINGAYYGLFTLRAALARCQPAEIPTELNVDTPAPVAPRDMEAEAREANCRG